MGEIRKIVEENGLDESNYELLNFNVYANTSYKNGVSTVLGQIASQTFEITIPTISSDGSNIGKLIDDLANINGIILNGLSFDLSDKTAAFE